MRRREGGSREGRACPWVDGHLQEGVQGEPGGVCVLDGPEREIDPEYILNTL